MDYFAKSDSPFSANLWQEIERNVIEAVKENIVARKFLHVYGPVGAGASYALIDSSSKKEVRENGVSYFENRAATQIPQLYEDFWLYWRDIAYAQKENMPLDLSHVRAAAMQIANHEDNVIFNGIEKLGIDGLLTAEGVKNKKISDWGEGENAFKDVSVAIGELYKTNKYGRHTLILSPDLFIKLQRIQPGTGVLESERIEKMLDGGMFITPMLKQGSAMLISAQPQYMDLLIGQDITVAYTEAVDLNHRLRIVETILPRIKEPEAIIILK